MNSATLTPLSRSIDGAILIALLSTLCYAMAFAFSCGYGAFFHVPAMLVEANPKNLLVCAAAVFLGFPMLLPLADFGLQYWPRSWPAVVRKTIIRIIAPAAVIPIAYFLIGPEIWLFLLGGLCIVVVVSIFELAMPLTHKAQPSYVAKLEARRAEVIARRRKSPGLMEVLAQRFGRTSINYAVFAIFALPVAYGYGYRDARTQVIFLVTTTAFKCAIVGTYGENLICNDFDGKAHRVTDHLRLLPIRESGFELVLQRIGPLAPADVPRDLDAVTNVAEPPKVPPKSQPVPPTPPRKPPPETRPAPATSTRSPPPPGVTA